MELYKKYPHSTQKGVISLSGINAIQKLINAQRPTYHEEWKAANPDSTLYTLPTLPETWEWVWLVQRGELRGTFPKRVGQYYFKTHHVKCPQTFIESVGNLARRHSSDLTAPISLEFVNQIDWDQGDFGDGSSCYWDSRAGAKQMLEQNGALAVRLYDESGIGFARAWVVPLPDDLHIVFNGHGFVSDSTLIFARIVADFFSGKAYKSISLSNLGDTSGALWIDGGQGFVIGLPEQIESIQHHNFEWPEIWERTCNSCGDPITDDPYVGPDGEEYCEDCYSDRFTYCDHCGQDRWAHDVQWVDGADVCDYCLERDFTTCEECGETVPNADIRDTDGMALCLKCYAERAPKQRK